MAAQILVVLLVSFFVSNASAVEDDLSSKELDKLLQDLRGCSFYHQVYPLRYPPDFNSLMSEFNKNYEKRDDISWARQISLSPANVVQREAPILAVRFSTYPRKPRRALKPMFMFVANIQGDDALSYALLVYLMKYLAHSYQHNHRRIVQMLEDIDIWIFPNINPRGFLKSEMRRCDPIGHLDFPQNIDAEDYWYSQSETQSWIQFIKDKPFVLSGIIQGGALGANYDSKHSNLLSQDNEFLKKLANEFAEENPMVATRNKCKASFKDGKTKGYKSRRTPGGIQDADDIISNCFEMKLNVGCCKYPNNSDLPYYFAANLQPMLNFIESTRRGVYGLVKDTDGWFVKDAVIKVTKGFMKVEGSYKDIKVTMNGEYWRLLVQGKYHITASSPGFTTRTQLAVVPSDNSYVRLDFVLTRLGVFGRVIGLNGSTEEAVITVLGEDKVIRVPVNAKYSIPLNRGRHTLTAEAAGYLTKTRTVNVNGNEPPIQLDIFLSPCGVHGWVRDPLGNVSDVETVITVEDAKEMTVNEVIKVHGEDKTFKVPVNGEYFIPLNLGRFTLSAKATGYLVQTQTVDVTKAKPYFGLDFDLKRHGIHGLVQDDAGETFTKAVITPVVIDGKKDDKMKTTIYGKYWLPLDVGKSYSVTASASGYASQTKTVELTNETPYVNVGFVLSSNSLFKKLPSCFKAVVRP